MFDHAPLKIVEGVKDGRWRAYKVMIGPMYPGIIVKTVFTVCNNINHLLSISSRRMLPDNEEFTNYLDLITSLIIA